ncbi:hypothetical protein LH51_06090, partial [Nitrincola sp. A-D6]|uniref:TSUP family transporter n=1 Tax=Nitrincola sp. A-D6 TaxID=1545442 RepID=UPI00051FBBB2
LAVAATAVVHFTNNLFKFGLMARKADWSVVARFSVPAAVAAFLGAGSLAFFNQLPPLWHYTLASTNYEITAVKAVIGSLIVLFALLELSSRFQALAFPAHWLPVGGVLSGFFGGLSGNQGALRSAFLLKAGLSKEAFVATGIVSAVIVDAARLVVYGTAILATEFSQAQELILPVVVGSICAFIGSFFGKRLLPKVTLRTVQLIVAIAMLGIGSGLALGLL